MILERMTPNAGCIAPLIMAAMQPTKMKGHSELLRRISLKNDAGGLFSSCKNHHELGYTEARIISIEQNFFFSFLLTGAKQRIRDEQKLFNESFYMNGQVYADGK